MEKIIIAIVIAIIAFLIINYFSNKVYKKDYEKADEFLKERSDQIYQKMVEATKRIENDEKFGEYMFFEDYVLESGYFLSWKYIKQEVQDSDLPKSAKKLFETSDYTLSYIEKEILKKSDILDIIKSIWIDKFEEKIKEMEDEEDISYGIDEEGNKVPLVGPDYIEDIDTVELDSIDNFDSGLEPAINQKIIPPSDSEEEPEYIKEVTDEDEIIIDSKGRKRNKKNGRFV